ncbi:hypothetical protein M422DRAFT_262169 [Sphaerobolus stellatus SS14]|uniref:Uncharacterized protein n=1 Tax=Sphaerobolus stellatus (strain SS14) TaxID=990650 RepID=A0A0C9V1M1_SPHS4|nr:hypothetical protein M422DRAFT_262169 [Sphaerobolus stellatus SS14]
MPKAATAKKASRNKRTIEVVSGQTGKAKSANAQNASSARVQRRPVLGNTNGRASRSQQNDVAVKLAEAEARIAQLTTELAKKKKVKSNNKNRGEKPLIPKPTGRGWSLAVEMKLAGEENKQKYNDILASVRHLMAEAGMNRINTY